VNFPFICSNVSAAHGVYISMLIRYSSVCGSYHDFFDRGLLLTTNQLNPGLIVIILNSLLFRSTWVHPWFLVGSCCLIFSFLCNVLLIIVCTFVPFWPLYCLFFFDLRIMIIPLVSSAFHIADLCYILCITWTYYYTFYIHAITFILLWINAKEYRRGNPKKLAT
jgi:hypothetical protein